MDVELKMEPEKGVSLTVKNMTENDDWTDEMDSLIDRIKALEGRNNVVIQHVHNVDPLVLECDPKPEPVAEDTPPEEPRGAIELTSPRDDWGKSRAQWFNLVTFAARRAVWEETYGQNRAEGFRNDKVNRTPMTIGYVCEQLDITPEMLQIACRDECIPLKDGKTLLSGEQALQIMEYVSAASCLRRMTQRLKDEEFWYDTAVEGVLTTQKTMDRVQAEISGLWDVVQHINLFRHRTTQPGTGGILRDFARHEGLRVSEMLRVLSLPDMDASHGNYHDGSAIGSHLATDLLNTMQPKKYLARILELLGIPEGGKGNGAKA